MAVILLEFWLYKNSKTGSSRFSKWLQFPMSIAWKFWSPEKEQNNWLFNLITGFFKFKINKTTGTIADYLIACRCSEKRYNFISNLLYCRLKGSGHQNVGAVTMVVIVVQLEKFPNRTSIRLSLGFVENLCHQIYCICLRSDDNSSDSPYTEDGIDLKKRTNSQMWKDFRSYKPSEPKCHV